MIFESANSALHWFFDEEHLQIQPWGSNAFHVRSTKLPYMPASDWALSEPIEQTEHQVTIPKVQQILNAPEKEFHGSHKAFEGASITNGPIEATLAAYGRLCISNIKSDKQVME
jgi:hypothetical protein